jgi:glucosamine--fructose-6-phosphate aminotransferase (isomerizing)
MERAAMTDAPMIERLAADMADQAPALARLARAYGPGGVAAGRLAAAMAALAGRPVALVGSGASHAACVAAAASWRQSGLAVEAPEAGEFLHYDPRVDDSGLGVVVVTYSGQSAEAVAIVARRRGGNAPTVLVSESIDGPLAASCIAALPLHCGIERATATKSFTNTLGVLLLLGRATDAARSATTSGAMADLLGDRAGLADRLFEAMGGIPPYLDVVGRGPAYGTALFGGLVLRELLALRGGWMTSGHFRHGPLLDVGTGHRLIVVAGRRTLELGLGLARDAAARGGRAILIADGAAPGAPGVLTLPITAPDEATFALLAAVPFELYMARAARDAGTRYVRIQTTSE